MSLPIEQVVALYSLLLTPIPQLSAIGLSVSTLDVLGCLRLALAVKQIKHSLRLKAAKKAVVNGGPEAVAMSEKLERSNVGAEINLATIWSMFVIVYGGELLISSFVSEPPSFFTSATGPIMFTLSHVVIEQGFKFLPSLLPIQPNLKWELPFAILDALARSALLCSYTPPYILGHRLATIRENPQALLLCGMLNANAGFFLVNTFSMLSPNGWSVQTPPELEPWGWTSLDILVAPIMTALFATLTHSQSVWRDAHIQATSYMGYGPLKGNFTTTNEKYSGAGTTDSAPFDDESARAICAMILMGLFSGRALKNFGGMPAFARMIGMGSTQQKLKTQ
ncbi:hypothetical protein FRB94_011152 [Tulasnella sp. JGI-2019a]|nr:hypothetical protein FRB94_011152 [Tulasnella sp. JGI-2019a]KAG9004526.1 hypothetical protein FRB93_010303 [Tulasnella sp. JGI-2019a]KAG9034275.1 hypothetical protein FRB95_013433 [Tulasnella sp. JGI-2019a]